MKLLFFSHTCARTGSELALFRLICSADRETTKMAVACGARGELSKTFPRDVPVFNYWHALSFADRAFKNDKLGPWLAKRLFNGVIRLIHERVRPDAWYLNTILQPDVLALARELQIPCILHTHECELMFSQLKPNDIANMIQYPKLIIAASQCAANVLRILGRQGNIEVCSGPINMDGVNCSSQRSKEIRQDLRIPPAAFVWAMSGSRDTNKDPVGFVRIAAELLKREPETYFLWIGGSETGYSLYARALAKKLGIDGNISWVPDQAEYYYDYLNLADGFLLTSHSESLSMVALEAAALGKPFVSFNSGGPQEIFRDGMGVIVNSWSEQELAAGLLQVMRAEIYLNADISRSRAAEFDVSLVVKHWEGIIRKCITE